MIDKRLIAAILMVMAIIFYKWTALLIGFLALVLLLLIIWVVLRRQYWLRVHGFWVERVGLAGIKYEERRNGKVERLTIPGEHGIPYTVYVPSETEWDGRMPEWARGRRDEIMRRVKVLLGHKLKGLFEHLFGGGIDIEYRERS